MKAKGGWYGNDTRKEISDAGEERLRTTRGYLLLCKGSCCTKGNPRPDRMSKWDVLCARIEERLKFHPKKDREDSPTEINFR